MSIIIIIIKRGLRAKMVAGITNGCMTHRKRRNEMYSESAYRVAEEIMRMIIMWIMVLRKV